jgi:hypothetical protein
MKILGLKDKHQISSLQSAERGSVVRVVTCMSPTGHFIPPLHVFPRKKYETKNDEWNTSWINPGVPSLGVHTERDFFQWSLHFIKHTKPIKEDPVILVLVGHYSHTRNLKVITLARENHLSPTSQQPQNATLG